MTVRRTPIWRSLAACLAVLFALGMVTTACKKKKKEKPEVKEKEAGKKTAKAARPGAHPAGGQPGAAPALNLPTSAAGLGDVGPAGVNIGLNVAKIRTTFLWKMFMGMPPIQKAQSNKIYAKMRDTCKFDMFKQVDSIVIGFKDAKSLMKGPPKKTFAVLVKGKFNAPGVLNCVKAELAKDKPKKVTIKDVQAGGKPALAFVEKGETYYMAAPAADTLAIGGKDMLAVLGKTDPNFGSPALTKLTSGLNRGAALWGAFTEVPIPAEAKAKLPPMVGGLTSVKGGAFHIDPVGGNWNLLIHVVMGTPKAVDSIKKLLDLAKMAPMMAQRSGKPIPPKKKLAFDLLSKLRVATKGSSIQLSLSLPQALIQSLAQKAAK
jgi:hypothetical protein